MSRGLLVTGTDTGVGKTLVAGALARILRRRGVDVGVLKIAATGVPPDDDAQWLRSCAGSGDPPNLVSPLRYTEPLAPAVAADRAGTGGSTAAILAAWHRLLQTRAFVVAEGVGGLLVPITWEEDVAAVAARMEVPLIVVARSTLGTLNHTALTVEAAQRRGLRVLGVVLSRDRDGEADVAESTNPQALRRMLEVPVLGTLPRLTTTQRADPDAVAAALESACDLSPVMAEVEA